MAVNGDQGARDLGYKDYADYQNAMAAQNSGGGSSGGGGFKPLSATDVAGVSDTVYKTLQPYYLQLAKEAKGDFNRAVATLHEDYVKGTRDQRVQFAFTQNKQLEELTSTLKTLGISNAGDQRSLIDDLNKRGMAVYQNNPDGTPNALSTTSIDANTTANPDGTYGNTSTLSNPANGAMGEGGFELSNLERTQQLKQEAEQRAATKPIEQAGIQLKQYTNLPDGIDPNLPPDKLAAALAAPGVDRSKLGSSEQNLIRGEETQTRTLQQTQEDLANQRANDVANITGQVSQSGSTAGAQDLANKDLQNKTNNFVTTGS